MYGPLMWLYAMWSKSGVNGVFKRGDKYYPHNKYIPLSEFTPVCSQRHVIIRQCDTRANPDTASRGRMITARHGENLCRHHHSVSEGSAIFKLQHNVVWLLLHARTSAGFLVHAGWDTQCQFNMKNPQYTESEPKLILGLAPQTANQITSMGTVLE